MVSKVNKAALVIVGSIAFAVEGQAESIYDGIYQLDPNFGYVTLREQNGSMVAVINQTLPDLRWGAATGALNGSSVRLSTVIGTVNTTVDVTFTSPSTFQATQVSCTPDPGYYCIFQNGATFSGKKIW